MGKLNCVKRGCAVSVLCAATALALPAQTFTTVHYFDGTDGATSNAGLVQATDGNFYGTTYDGGADSAACGSFLGCGTVFKITSGGTLTSLYSFCSQSNCADGLYTQAALVQGTDGNFYGTTYGGGANSCIIGITPYGCGTVFKITPGGTLTTVYSFCSESNCGDGQSPYAPLVQATDGNLYGTTYWGGANNEAGCGGLGCGTVFKITPGGTLTTLHSFCSESNCGDGKNPFAPLVQATDGNLYGTTSETVFKITPSGTLTTLYSFCTESNCGDGENAYAPLVQAADGNFYGTTSGGGTNPICHGPGGCGTVFEITPSGTLTTLHSFDGSDGWFPTAGLVQATDGNFYGTTSGGGAGRNCGGIGCGTVFKITPSGTLTTLHSFNVTDGAGLYAGLIQATDGTFYGTTDTGGNEHGTIFSLSVGLGPFVKTQSASGWVGAAVNILGTI